MTLNVGQLESTLVETFLRGASLRKWLADKQHPEALKVISDLLNKTLPPEKGLNREKTLEENNTNAMEIDVEEPVENVEISPLHVARLKAANQRRAISIKLYKRFRINGVAYSIHDSHPGNSVIQYRVSNASSRYEIGEIQQIILDSDILYLSVKRHKCLPPGVIDPFTRYQDFPAALFSADLMHEEDLIEAARVVSHVARCKVKYCKVNCAVLVSLNRYF